MKQIGLIGFGMIGEKHLHSFRQIEGVEVTWIADKVDSILDKAKNEWGVPHVTKDYYDILKQPDVQAVVICTPPNSHLKILSDCLEHGKHVLVEKPTAITRTDLDMMVDLDIKYPGLKVLDCSCRHSRLQPVYQKVKEIVDSGSLGDIYYIHHNSCFRQGRPGIEYHPTAKWFLNKQIAGGGTFLDWGVYDLSFHLGILNDLPELQQVVSFSKTGLDEVKHGGEVYDVEEHGVSMMQFSHGLRYYWERASHSNVEVPNETRVYGTRGGLKFPFLSWDSCTIEYYDLDEGGKARHQTITVEKPEGHDDELELARHFVKVLDGEEQPMMPLSRAVKHLKIIFEVYEGMTQQ